MSSFRALQLMTCCAIVAGCGGGGDGIGRSNAFCHAIPVHAVGCQNCAQVSDTGAAFDDNFDSYAIMGPGGQGTFLAGTQPQIAGSVAGVYFVPPSPQNTSISITTLLGGNVQDQQSVPATRSGVGDQCSNASTPSPVCDWNDGGGSFVGIETTKSYDEIHVTVSNSAASDLHVNEICVR